MDWNIIVKTAQDAFRDGVNAWIAGARIQGGQINGPNAFLTPGSLMSTGNVEVTVLQKLIGSQVPPEIARAVARELGAAWNAWAAGFQVQLPAAYPAFAAFPGPLAPPTPAATGPIALARGSSVGEFGLRAPILAGKLISAVKPFARNIGVSPETAMTALAKWVDVSFTEWKGLAGIVGLLGKGPVPTFAPPYVPVGPVVAGENFTTGPVFVGPRFGRVVF